MRHRVLARAHQQHGKQCQGCCCAGAGTDASVGGVVGHQVPFHGSSSPFSTTHSLPPALLKASPSVASSMTLADMQALQVRVRQLLERELTTRRLAVLSPHDRRAVEDSVMQQVTSRDRAARDLCARTVHLLIDHKRSVHDIMNTAHRRIDEQGAMLSCLSAHLMRAPAGRLLRSLLETLAVRSRQLCSMHTLPAHVDVCAI